VVKTISGNINQIQFEEPIGSVRLTLSQAISGVGDFYLGIYLHGPKRKIKKKRENPNTLIRKGRKRKFTPRFSKQH